jgi:predicted nucleic-acid-binding Zn-ribbon protein
MEKSTINPQKFLEWLNQHWKTAKICPICGNTEWLLNDKLWELREFTEGTIRLGGPIMPLGTVQCKNCGHTLLFNALTSGFMEQNKEKDSNSKESTLNQE